ncbi:MAG: M6 family metalloprotease domain-containing protein [Clostridia bacterium]|nr:M6 family metalloprotease domain-containing protein [Clostridia bacterium]
MKHEKTIKTLLTVLLTVLLFVIAAVCAWAVPAKPDAGYEGDNAACRSHHGELVTLESIPSRRVGAHLAPSIAPAEKNIPLLTIVIGFENMPYDNSLDWHEAIYSGEKSLEAYYSDMSFGRFTFTPAAETCAYGVGGCTNAADRMNDGVVHVKLDCAHKDWAGEDEYPALARALIDAFSEADACVDFASFDADGDGAIAENELAVGFVVAGYEGSASYSYPKGKDKYLWAHAWSIGEIVADYSLEMSVPTPDGTAVSAYIAIAEHLNDENDIEPISVLAHELGHYLGLPDLYDTTYHTSAAWGKYAVGDASVMADGSWGDDPDGGYIPYSMDVWSRYALGWFTPQEVRDSGEYAVAAQSYSENEAFSALLIPTQREGEYYLLENRQFTKWDAGMADTYLTGGIIVWHIDDAVFERYHNDNQVNDTFHRPAVMPLYAEQQDGAISYIGAAPKVLKNKPFYSESVWNDLFPEENALLDLPLYGEGDGADDRAARTLSGLKLGFPDESAAEMTVLFSNADHAHFLRFVAAEDPACETPGCAAHWVCGYCGGLFADAEGETPTTAAEITVPPAGHSFGAWSVTKSAGCETEGEKTRVCVGCGGTEQESIKATGHAFGEWELTTEPFCETAGERVRSCANCGKKQTESVGPLGHTEPDEDGCCARCGARLVSPETPGQTQNPDDLCPFCGKDHNAQPFGKIIRVFHRILYFFGKLFGKF